MRWKPEVNLPIGYEKSLTDLELKKVKNLQESLRHFPLDPERGKIEIEIWRIYKDAVGRDSSKNNGMKQFLTKAESAKIEEYKEMMMSASDEKTSIYYESLIYQVYQEAICLKIDFPLKEIVQKYIDWLQKCETTEEANVLSEVIRDLHKWGISR